MFLIVVHHYVYNGVIDIKAVYGTEQSFALQLWLIGGNVGVILFLLIGSYFVYQKPFNISRPMKLIYTVFIYSWGIFIAANYFYPQEWELAQLRTFLMPMTRTYWFIDYYVLLLCGAPFINTLTKEWTREKYLSVVGLSIVLILGGPTLNLYSLEGPYMRLMTVLLVYLTAGYVRTYNDAKVLQWKPALALFMLSVISFVGLLYLRHYKIVVMGINENISHLTRLDKLLPFLIAVSLFGLAHNLPKFSSRLINYLSGATFGVYIIHEQPFVRDLLWKNFRMTKYTRFHTAFGGAVIQGGLVFIGCLAVALIATPIINLTFSIINRCILQPLSRMIQHYLFGKNER